MKKLVPVPVTAIAVGFFLTGGTPIFAQNLDNNVISRDGGHPNANNEEYAGVEPYPYNERYGRNLYHDPGDYDGMYYGKGPLPYSEKDWMFYEYYKDEDLLSSDIELRAQILKNLDLSPYVYSESIHVSVKSGIATLSGNVEDRSEMIDAVEIAYDSGAWKVRNKLRPRDKDERLLPDMGDRELQEEIQDELAFSPFVNADRIQVSVQDGVATLYGGVENKGEIADAVENAYEAGAKRVKSRLWVDSDIS